MNPWIIPGLRHLNHEKTTQKSKNTFQLTKDFTALKKIAQLELKPVSYTHLIPQAAQNANNEPTPTTPTT